MAELKQKVGLIIEHVSSRMMTISKPLMTLGRSLGLTHSIILVGMILGLTTGACKKARKIDKRSDHDTADALSANGDKTPDQLPFTVKADSFAFRILEKVYIEPESCLPVEFNVVGGETEKYLASAPEDLEIKPTSSSQTSSYFSDEKCQNPLMVVSLPKDADGGIFYLKEQTPGQWKLQLQTVKGPAFKSPELPLEVAKGDLLKLELIPARTFTIENCEPVIMSLRAQGDKEIVSAKAFKVKVDITGGSAKVYTSESCSGEPLQTVQVPVLNPSVTLFVRPANSGPLTIVGEPESDSGYKKADITVNVDPKAS